MPVATSDSVEEVRSARYSSESFMKNQTSSQSDSTLRQPMKFFDPEEVYKQQMYSLKNTGLINSNMKSKLVVLSAGQTKQEREHIYKLKELDPSLREFQYPDFGFRDCLNNSEESLSIWNFMADHIS